MPNNLQYFILNQLPQILQIDALKRVREASWKIIQKQNPTYYYYRHKETQFKA